jgi:hypothetical protein
MRENQFTIRSNPSNIIMNSTTGSSANKIIKTLRFLTSFGNRIAADTVGVDVIPVFGARGEVDSILDHARSVVSRSESQEVILELLDNPCHTLLKDSLPLGRESKETQPTKRFF